MGCKNNKGFTLTEVLVVVLIVGVMAAIAYPVYTKAINKSRAVEAINLIEMVKNKQIANFARSGEYFSDFNKMGQLTANIAEENKATDSANMTVGKYALSLNTEASCIRAAYLPSPDKEAMFTFSASYERGGLGCDGDICSTFGNIVGNSASVCGCVDNCAGGHTLDPNTCTCVCAMECSSGGECKSKSQNNITSQSCGNGGTQTRVCEPSCDGGDCGEWGECKNQSCGGEKPAETEACGNCGTRTRTVVCESGSWKTGAWGVCMGQGVCAAGNTKSCSPNGTQTCSSTCVWEACVQNGCDPATKPNIDSNCGCGKLEFTYDCDLPTLTWKVAGTKCNNPHSCSDPSQTRPCGDGNGTQKCGTTCEWETAESCICNAGYRWNGTTCVVDACTMSEWQTVTSGGTNTCTATPVAGCVEYRELYKIDSNSTAVFDAGCGNGNGDPAFFGKPEIAAQDGNQIYWKAATNDWCRSYGAGYEPYWRFIERNRGYYQVGATYIAANIESECRYKHTLPGSGVFELSNTNTQTVLDAACSGNTYTDYRRNGGYVVLKCNPRTVNVKIWKCVPGGGWQKRTCIQN